MKSRLRRGGTSSGFARAVNYEQLARRSLGPMGAKTRQRIPRSCRPRVHAVNYGPLPSDTHAQHASKDRGALASGSFARHTRKARLPASSLGARALRGAGLRSAPPGPHPFGPAIDAHLGLIGIRLRAGRALLTPQRLLLEPILAPMRAAKRHRVFPTCFNRRSKQ